MVDLFFSAGYLGVMQKHLICSPQQCFLHFKKGETNKEMK